MQPHMLEFGIGQEMSALEDQEAFIRSEVEDERWTHKQVSDYLKEHFPGRRGYSVERFCSDKDIHKTSRISDQQLDEAVSTATRMVNIYYK